MFGRADLIYREGAEAMTALYLIGDTLLYGCLALLIGFLSSSSLVLTDLTYRFQSAGFACSSC